MSFCFEKKKTDIEHSDLRKKMVKSSNHAKASPFPWILFFTISSRKPHSGNQLSMKPIKFCFLPSFTTNKLETKTELKNKDKVNSKRRTKEKTKKEKKCSPPSPHNSKTT